MRRLILCLLLAIAAPMARADTVTDVLTQLMTSAPDTSQFAPSFLAAVPLPELELLLQGLRQTIGTPDDITVSGEDVAITTATHRLHGKIGLDQNGRIAMLFFEPPVPLVADLDSALAAIRALGTETAWLVTRDGATIAAQDANSRMAVASAFKLGVLAVLAEDVQSGQRRWDDVILLDAADISLPTGMLQDYPPGAPITLHTAAALMISVSDNTATDLLIRTLGRERIATALGLDTLLTTREFFALKADSAGAAAYLDAAPADRAAFAAKAGLTLPQGTHVLGHYTPGIEWHVPLTRLCALAAPLADLPQMAINPGPVNTGQWERIAYKGGSEPGVLNFTANLQDTAGRDLCVAITVNSDHAVDETEAVTAFNGLLTVLSRPD